MARIWDWGGEGGDWIRVSVWVWSVRVCCEIGCEEKKSLGV